jgi:molybdopterin molybdotransferase
MGKLPYKRPLVRATCMEGFSSPRGRKQYVRGHFEVAAHGAWVHPVGGHGSHLVASLARSNALIVVEEATSTVSEGQLVDVMVLDRNF